MITHPRDTSNLVDFFTNIPDYGRPDPYQRSHFVRNAGQSSLPVFGPSPTTFQRDYPDC